MNPDEHTNWVLGGKNMDEDPLFSQYYLTDSAKIYGGVRAFYAGLTEAYYIPADKAALLAQHYTHSVFRNPQWMRQNLAATQALLKKTEQFLDRHPVPTVPRLNIKSVIVLYKTQQRLAQRLYKLSRIPQALDRGSDYFTEYLLQRLRPYSGENTYNHFSLLTSPIHTSRFKQAELQENKLANHFILQDRPSTEKIRLHATAQELLLVENLAREFGHAAYHGYGSRKLLTVDEFWHRIQQKVNGNSKLPTLNDAEAKHKRMRHEQEHLIRTLGIDPALQSILTLYGEIALAKIDRRFTQVRNFVLLDALIGKISQSFNIPEIAIRFMTQDELGDIFTGQTSASTMLRRSMQRTQFCVWTYDQGGVRITTGQTKYEATLKATAGLILPRSRLTGIPVCTSPHMIRAQTRIIYRAEDTFAAGDVLVSEATDPDLVAHMRKAAAVLTEQGGVTSHASILARELQVPCIVGIKDLLCSVNNGDVLEIDTQQGLIRNLGQEDENIIGLEHVLSTTVQEFGGKAHGLFQLKTIGYGAYLPKTYLVKSAFSITNDNDITSLSRVVAALAPAKLAIRSSSALEDAEAQSWAGQFPTFLHVEPQIRAVKDTLEQLLRWKSTTSYINNAPLSGTFMRAIIQEQIDATISGVCFTKCPVTNDPSKIIIEFTRGLGDVLVSGKIIPSRLVYSKTKAEFIEITMANQQEITTYTNQAFIELVRIALHAEQSWHGPVDIEFAVDTNNNLKLLQCRHITT